MLMFIQFYLMFGMLISFDVALYNIRAIQKLDAGDTVKCWGKDAASAKKRAEAGLRTFRDFKREAAGAENLAMLALATVGIVAWVKGTFTWPKRIYVALTNKVYVRINRDGIVQE